MTSTAYCEVTDLLIGDVPTPDYVDKQKFVDNAGDEIDSKIGFIYQTPIDVSELSPVSRPARLLLKRINTWLASGRLLMSTDTAGEDKQVHAYALLLVKEATAALECIVTGEVQLDGATKTPTGNAARNAPLIYNKDAESSVEAFYDRVANPNYFFPPYETERISGR